MYNVNRDRLIKMFLDLVKIPSPSWKEENVIYYIEDKLKDLGIDYEKHKCNESYNLLARLKGDCKSRLPILFACHMDTVPPCENINPIVTDKKISSDGTTILGADDKAAIASFLEALYTLKENKAPHGQLEFLFTCAEEVGLKGIKGFNLSLLKAKYGFVFDTNGKIGRVTTKGPYHISMDVAIKGKASHAGMEPEKGVSAIIALADIISRIPHGRIDEETTVNVGTVSGGVATNIVSENAKFNLEARSIDYRKLKSLESEIKTIIMDVARTHGARVKISRKLDYPGFSIKHSDEIIQIVNNALKNIRITPEYLISGGGSDTNIINKNKKGLMAVNLSIGMRNVHTKKEYILISDLLKGTRLILSIIDSI